jgi:hypothetical protein
MKIIKFLFVSLFVLVLLGHFFSCAKKDSPSVPKPLADSVAQDFSYRTGKWYSVSNGAGFNFSTNPLLDTIWFVSDSVAGWSAFGGHPYVFWPTYFSDAFHIVYITPDPLDTTKLDTVVHECGMTTHGDTFVVYWPTSSYQVFPEHYVKMKN